MKYKGLTQMFHFSSLQRASTCALVGAVYALGCSGSIDANKTADEPERDVSPPIVNQPAPPAPIDEPVVEDEPPAKALLQAQVEDILNRQCSECHGANGRREAGMNYIEDFDQLAQNDKIVPGSAATSPIMVRLRGGTMPPPGSGFEPPTPDEIEQIGQFIDAWDGPASLAPEVCDGQRITFDEVYKAMVGDLFLQDTDDREFIRYVGVTNRYNAGVCDDKLDVERFSLTKLLNSLSTEARISEPVAIDDTNLIYRIDIRRYGWDRGINGANDGWEAILAESPYAVPFVGDEADILTDQMNTAVPYLFADALAHVASVGDLYYGLVDIPGSVDQLQANLRIDAQDNLDRGLVARAGTQNSGVSTEDRLVERQEIGLGGGVYWQAFEFDNGAQLFNEPLDFQAIGSEAIFSLPNGLHGYAIFDENGNTVEESDILFDTVQGDFTVTSAVSCMTCHSRGLLQVRDEVRTFVEANPLDFNSEEFEIVRDVYPGVDAMDDLISADRRTYQAALQQAGVPIEVADPVSNVFFRFEKNVKLADVAGDLGVTPELLEDNLNRLDPQLRILRADLPVRRRNFEAVYAESLCRLQVASSNRPDDAECNF